MIKSRTKIIAITSLTFKSLHYQVIWLVFGKWPHDMPALG